MSLEQAIERNTAALEQLIGILSKPPVEVLQAPIDPPSLVVIQEPMPAEPVKDKPKRAKKPVEVASAPSPETGATDAKPAEDAAPATEITRMDCSHALTTLSSRKGRPAAMGLLAKHGAKALGDVDPANYAAFHAEAQALLNG
jgi:hypothetical protein